MLTVGWFLLGCGEPTVVPVEPTPTPTRTAQAPSSPVLREVPTMRFDPLSWDDAFLDATEPVTTAEVALTFQRFPVRYQPLLSVGEGGSIRPYAACDRLDAGSLFTARGALWASAQLGCATGGVAFGLLERSAEGSLRTGLVRAAELDAVGGLTVPVAGATTPWGTQLVLEGAAPDDDLQDGFVAQVAVMTTAADTLTGRHVGMGRFAHGAAVVLPDERTVYLTDRSEGGSLYLFVADRPADLSSGRLYAARLRHDGVDPAGPRIAVEWIDLGGIGDREIERALADGVGVDDLIERSAPRGGACPEGAWKGRVGGVDECLTLRPPTSELPSPARLASRIATARYAAYLGATTELSPITGAAYDDATGSLFFSMPVMGPTMAAEPERGEGDHVQLLENPCGGLLMGYTTDGQRDHTGQPIDSERVLTRLRTGLLGAPTEPNERGERCAAIGPANPTVIDYVPGYDVLLIGEDTDRKAASSLWALDTRRSDLRRVLVAPRGHGIGGVRWVPDLGGSAYIAVTHRPGRAAAAPLEGVAAEVGALGPFVAP